MTRLGILLSAAAVLLGGCQQKLSPAEQASADARAVAMVEAAQNIKAPAEPVDLQPITAADIAQNKLYGAGCTLVPGSGPGGDPVLVANPQRAVAKIDGKFVIFAADSGSALLGGGARTHYVGRAQSLVLGRSGGDGTQLGEDGLRWNGSVTVRDANHQLVYTSTGQLACDS